jgi:isopenicillin-N N-acyltransferase-like protein
MSQQLQTISVKGKPFDCGQQHGTQARELIRRNIDSYWKLWNILLGMKKKEILAKSREFVPIIGEYDADILEELEGIASGAGLPLEEIIALNARYELVWAQSTITEMTREGCTSLCALPEVTEGGHTLLAENWDYKPIFQDSSIVLEVEQQDKPNVVTHTEAGTLGIKGMNSAGIGENSVFHHDARYSQCK